MTIGHTAAQFLARSRDETRCLVHTPIPVVLLLLFFFFLLSLLSQLHANRMGFILQSPTFLNVSKLFCFSSEMHFAFTIKHQVFQMTVRVS